MSMPRGERALLTCVLARLPGGRLGLLELEIGHHQVGATPGGLDRRRPPDAAAAADDHDHEAAQLLLRGLAAELGLFELPVFDGEGLGERQRDVVVVDSEALGGGGGPRLRQLARRLADAERRRALHDVDGVDVELGDDARLALGLAEGEHAHARDEHDARVVVAQRRRRRLGVRLVILEVILAVAGEGSLEAGAQLGDGRARIPVHDERADPAWLRRATECFRPSSDM
jgi:hypothetical protein